MTPLRQQMIRAMRQRGFSVRTHQSYLAAVSALARYHGRSPADLDVGQLQAYFNYLAQERGLSSASCRLHLNAVRFLYFSRTSFHCSRPKLKTHILRYLIFLCHKELYHFRECVISLVEH